MRPVQDARTDTRTTAPRWHVPDSTPNAAYWSMSFPSLISRSDTREEDSELEEADLVAYKGRAAHGQQMTTLLYASPTETEALVFALDRARVGRWLVANSAATQSELDEAGGAHRWFAAGLDPEDGQLPRWDPDLELMPGDPEYGIRLLFGLLHSTAHQVLRALAVDSGYSETGLSEYLFPYELSFAVHPNGGSEFTIGGLRTVLEQNLDEVVTRAVENATCIYDPNCMVANRGSDHGCLQLPETACQSWNRFISRWDLFGSPDGDVIGYWDPALDESSSAPSSWSLVATLPPDVLSSLQPPPLRQTAGVMLELIDSATRVVWLAAPFVDSQAVRFLCGAITSARCRGVDVHVITSVGRGVEFASLRNDSEPLRGRIHVTEVQTDLSTLGSHAKVLVVDHDRAYVGSANLTTAGFGRHVEMGVEVVGRQVEDLTRLLVALERLGTRLFDKTRV